MLLRVLSSWLACSITLGLRQDRTSWWKGIVKENHSPLGSLEAEGKLTTEEGARDKIYSSETYPNDLLHTVGANVLVSPLTYELIGRSIH